MRDEFRGKDAHEPGQNHQCRRVCIDCVGQRRIKSLSRRVLPVWHQYSRYAMRGRGRKPCGFTAIADHRGDLDGKPTAVARTNQGLHVATMARHKDDNAQHGQLSPQGWENPPFYRFALHKSL